MPSDERLYEIILGFVSSWHGDDKAGADAAARKIVEMHKIVEMQTGRSAPPPSHEGSRRITLDNFLHGDGTGCRTLEPPPWLGVAPANDRLLH